MDTRRIAVGFVKTLSPEQKDRVSVMLAHGVTVGADFARASGIEPEQLTQELRLIFNGR